MEGQGRTEDLAADETMGLALRWAAEGRKVAMATVIRTWGSAPRRAGSRMVVDGGGNFAGSVSGGCIENAVILEAQDAIGDGRHRVVDFGVSDEDAWEVGLACGGEVSVLVERVEDKRRGLLADAVRMQGERTRFALATDLGSGETHLVEADDTDDSTDGLRKAAAESLATDVAKIVEAGDARAFVEPFNPRPRTIIVGAVHIAQALAPICQALGHETHVVDPRERWADKGRFPGIEVVCSWPQEALPEIGLDERTAVVTLTHDPKIDDPALKLALESPTCYVGALGSKRTHAKRIERLKEAGVGDEALSRIHSPVGVDIGAATAAEIGLSVAAELVSALRKGDRD